MSKILMSEALVGRIDEDLLFDKTTSTSEGIPTFELTMEHGDVAGSLVHGEWSPDGYLCKIVLKLVAEDIQKVLEGIRICSVNFRSPKTGKNVRVNLGNVQSITHAIDVIEGQTFITVTIHPIVDT